MRKRRTDTRNGRGGPGARLGTLVVSAIATASLVASMCPGTMAPAYANGQLAGGAADVGEQAVATQSERVIMVTKDTHHMSSGTYRVTGNVEIGEESFRIGNCIRVEKGAKVLLIIDKGATLTVKGRGGNVYDPGRAAILLPEGSTLTVAGEGTLNATGGHAGNGEDGDNAGGYFVSTRRRSALFDTRPHYVGGSSGKGGCGGYGAGAGIGTDGGGRGYPGRPVDGFILEGPSNSNMYNDAGNAGYAGVPAAPAGTLIATGNVTVNAKGGAAGSGGKGGNRGGYGQERGCVSASSWGTPGGGGGGGGGGGADGIGSGGTGGGGGGSGAGGNLDGECAFFGGADLDDLWGHGGLGGSSSWGGTSGKQGDEGASNGGDDTRASRKYAKAGGAGGSSAAPKVVPFYTYKDSPTASPKVNCTSGHGVTRTATNLGSMDAFKNLSGLTGLVSGGTHEYDGKQHGASVSGAGKLSAQSVDNPEPSTQAAGEEGAWPDKGTVDVDGVKVSYSVAYYDAEGNELGSAPVMPGQYAAVVTFASDNPDYCGDWVEPVTITKRQVAKPTPADLVFECADWTTGEGVEQDAFPGLGDTDYELVTNAKEADGSASLRSAKEAGSYAACFKLKDPSTCQWEGESEDAAECWVPWSIALSPFDPNDVTYWGTARDNETTTVDYTGEPVWVRPWYTYAKDTDGNFPEWFTHWGSDDRPMTDRRSSCVLYLQGEDDYEGLVGYHTNDDGTLEPVTGEQVYAWANGVDVDGRHVAVEAGDKVWYKTSEDGWKIPLAVGGEKPEGAEGYVVARDYAYADKLGVMEPGEYQAYALFDEGTGFAPTALAHATVEVKAADAPVAAAKTPKTGADSKASASAAPKTGDLSPLALGGLALAALLGAGALALAARRRTRD